MLRKSKKVGVAVVGGGRISIAHLESIKKLNDKIELVAVVDINKKIAKQRAKDYGADKFYTELSDALKNSKIEAIVLCVPHYLHASLAIEAMRCGKHVLIEKPLALTLKEADKMIENAKKNNLVLMVAQSRRFYKAILKSKDLIPQIGTPFNITVTWNVFVPRPPTTWWKDPKKVGEGLIIDLNGPHLIDYILWIMEKKPCQLYALAYQNNNQWMGPDEAVITMKFDKGEIATAHLSFNARPEINEKIIVGSKGTMRIINDSEIWINDKLLIKHEEEMDYLKGGSNFIRQIEEFINAIIYNQTPLSSAEEVRKVVEVVEVARESLKENKCVSL